MTTNSLAPLTVDAQKPSTSQRNRRRRAQAHTAAPAEPPHGDEAVLRDDAEPTGDEVGALATLEGGEAEEGEIVGEKEGVGALVERARRGDRVAIDRLLAEARQRAVAVAMKVLRNPNDAEDAVQDALLKIWRYLPRFEGRSSFFTWVHRIVMNSSLDLLRREKLRSEPQSHAEEGRDERRSDLEPSHEETPERQLASAQTATIVRAAVAELSVVHRDALALREFEERSYEEIAVAVRCPVGTVMSRLHHARRRLAEELVSTFGGEQELAYHAAA